MDENMQAMMQEMADMMSQMQEMMGNIQSKMQEMMGGEDVVQKKKQANYLSKPPSERLKMDEQSVMNKNKDMEKM